MTFKRKRKARVTDPWSRTRTRTRRERERERNLNGRRSSWLRVGAGRLVWPTGADTRRKHTRRNVARFVASSLRVPAHVQPTDTLADTSTSVYARSYHLQGGPFISDTVYRVPAIFFRVFSLREKLALVGCCLSLTVGCPEGDLILLPILHVLLRVRQLVNFRLTYPSLPRP